MCATSHEASLKSRFVELDDLNKYCLDEVMKIQMPHGLLKPFATMLIFLQPIAPMQLQNRYYTHLSEDFALKYQNEPCKALLQPAVSNICVILNLENFKI